MHPKTFQSGLTITPWTAACQAPLLMGFPRQEYWSGIPLPILKDHPNSGIECRDVSSISCIVRQILYHCTTWKPPYWQGTAPSPQLLRSGSSSFSPAQGASGITGSVHMALGHSTNSWLPSMLKCTCLLHVDKG